MYPRRPVLALLPGAQQPQQPGHCARQQPRALGSVSHDRPRAGKSFVPPTGAHDSYLPSEVCLWPPEPDAPDRKVYRSILLTANSYSPADYPAGWEVVTTA